MAQSIDCCYLLLELYQYLSSASKILRCNNGLSHLSASAGDEGALEVAGEDLEFLEQGLLLHGLEVLLRDIGPQDVLLYRQPNGAIPIPVAVSQRVTDLQACLLEKQHTLTEAPRLT